MSGTVLGSARTHGYRELFIDPPLAGARELWGGGDAAVEFRQRNQAQWDELERLTDQALRRGPSHLQPSDVETLARLYRRTAATLAFAREVVLDDVLVEYLETLTARAHLALQCGPRPHRIARFILQEIPRAVWRLRTEVGLAAGLLALGIVLGWIGTLLEPSWFFAFVDDELAIGHSPADKTEILRLALQPHGSQPSLAWAWLAEIATTGLVAFSLGFFAGIPSALVMLGGGLGLGALAALYFERGLSGELLAYLLAPGVPALVAFVLCGAAGLYVGRAVLFPGRRGLSESLRCAGNDTATVMLGALGLGAVAVISYAVCRQLELSAAWSGGFWSQPGVGCGLAGARSSSLCKEVPMNGVGPPAKVRFASPEGIALRIELARPTERVGALIVDLVLVAGAVAITTLLGARAGLGEASTLVWLGIFGVRHVYFWGFETRWQGITPGKRIFNLKVIPRHGGVLDARALLARTLMRDVELIMPVLLLMSFDAAHPLASIPVALWVIFMVLLPLLHPEHMRAGDLLAGTVVVRLPAPRSRSDEAQGAVSNWSFTPAQLSTYGEAELHALADLLRRSTWEDEANRRLLDSVAQTICAKLGIPGDPPADAEQFLRTFYAAQRSMLEHRRRLGRRKPNKTSPYEGS